MDISAVATPQPHYIPGYSGHVPQMIYRIGDTFGQQSHKLLIDPCARHAENLVLSTRTGDDFEVERPSKKDIDSVNEYDKQADPVYEHPMMPGYEGFVPRLLGTLGQRYSVAATEGLANFKRQTQKLKVQKNCPKHQETSAKNAYQFPLSALRPDCVTITGNEVRRSALPVIQEMPYTKYTPPHFMSCQNPEKYFKKGYTGHQPFSWPQFGRSHQETSKNALCDFTHKYQHRKSTEWAPIANAGVGTYRPNLKHNCRSNIYQTNTGMVPSYQGHVPGQMFSFGQTYGRSSRDAKKWLPGCNF